MSVAEKPIAAETPTQNLSARLALHSIIGGILVLVSLWVVLAGVPLAWGELMRLLSPDETKPLLNEFLSGALLILAVFGAAFGLGYLLLQLEQAHAAKGLREGALISAFLLYLIMRLTFWIGMLMLNAETVGIVVTVGIGVGLVFLLYKWMSMPGFTAFLGRVQDAGWFETNVVKGNQGVKIRRLTVVGFLLIGFWGIITGINMRTFGAERVGQPTNDWEIKIPFTGTEDAPHTLPVIFKAHVVVPILLGILLIWFSWRIVNLPGFTDFLIATEAEMNKVSWTTRKRLFQDTIVVLVTLFLVTTFLFLIDIFWIQVLSWEPIGVLQVNPHDEQQKLKETARW